MRETRRRKRTRDPLASRAAVGVVLEGLRRRLGAKAPAAARDLAGLVRAAERSERETDRQAGRGRPPRWDTAELRRALLALRSELAARGCAHIGARTFAGHYLSILAFPPDVAEALESGRVNLFEAEQLARLTAPRLGVASAVARRRRADLLRAHIGAAESGARLRARVGDMLANVTTSLVEPVSSISIAEAAANLEKELDAMRRSGRHGGTDPDLGPRARIPAPDPAHLFYEHLTGIAFVLDEVGPADLNPDDLARVLDRADALLLALQQIRRRSGRGSRRAAI